MSEAVFKSKYPKGVIPRKSDDFGKVHICRRGLNLKTSLYTEPFTWEHLEHSTGEEVHQLIDFLEKDTKGNQKRKFGNVKKREDNFTGGFVEEEEDSDVDMRNTTPRKKRKMGSVPTPRKPRTPSKLLTPRHKRYVLSFFTTTSSC